MSEIQMRDIQAEINDGNSQFWREAGATMLGPAGEGSQPYLSAKVIDLGEYRLRRREKSARWADGFPKAD